MIDKMYSNYHSHTKYCSHGIGSILDYVNTAIKHGLKEMGISDHGPNPKLPVYYTIGEYETEYYNEIQEAKKLYSDRIKIYSALEMDFFPQFIPYYKYLLTKYDYLGLSCHFFRFASDNNELYKYTYHQIKTSEDSFEYANLLCEGIRTKLFLIVFHPDIFIDYGTPNVKECSEMIIKEAIKNDVYIEFNLAQFELHILSKNIDFKTHPKYEFWKLVSLYQAKVVIDSDAHKPDNLVPDYLDKTLEIIKDLDLNVVKVIGELHDC